MSYQDLQDAVSKGPSAIARYTWVKEENGRKIACLLATIAPVCGKERSEAVCPSSIMRPWLAYLTVWLDDCGSQEAWWDRIKRYANVIERVSHLDDAADQKLQYAIRALCVREAMSHTNNAEAIDICQSVVKLCESVASGNPIDVIAFAEARERANSFWYAAEDSPSCAIRVAGAAAAEAAVAAAARWSVPSAESAESADRLSSAIIDAMEKSVLQTQALESLCRILGSTPLGCRGFRFFTTALAHILQHAIMMP